MKKILKGIAIGMGKIGYYLSVAYYDVLFRTFFVILTLKLVLFDRFMGLGAKSFSPDFGTIVILAAFALVINGRMAKFSYLVFVDLVCSFIFIANLLYRGYFKDFATSYDLPHAFQLFSVLDSVVGLTNREVFFMADLAVLPFLAWKARNVRSFSLKERVRALCILLLLGLYCNLTVFTIMRGGVDFFNFVGERSIFVESAGIVNYQLFDLYCYVGTGIKKGRADESDVAAIKVWLMNKERDPEVSDLTATGRGKNLIVIQVESLQNFVIGRSYGGREITPHLNKLARGGIYFNRIYDQTAEGGSSDATFLANCSLYPSRKGAVSFLYASNCFDSLPKVLRAHGYRTAVLDPYVSSFWNSLAFDRSMGFDRQFYQDDFEKGEILGLGMSDREFLSQGFEKIRDFPSPFYVFLRTLTTHFPFDYVKRDDDDFPLGDLEGKTIGHYLRSMHYVDSAIGDFLRKLSEAGFGQRTVVAVYGDHRARISDDDLRRIGVGDLSEGRRIPLIIGLPERVGQETARNTVGGLIDFAPTICDILGVDTSDRFFMGKVLGDRGRNYVIFRDGSSLGDVSLMGRSSAEMLRISDLLLEKDMIRSFRNRKDCE